MKRLKFENYADFACEVADTFDNLEDEFGDVSILAKYDEAKEIIKELLCLGYDVASIDLHREDFEGYCDAYIVSLSPDGIWCEKFKRGNEYINDVSDVTYIIDNCPSAVIPHCKSKIIYEISVGEHKDTDNKELSGSTNDTQDSESTYVSRTKDGIPEGFSRSWTTTKDGYTCYSSFSHYSNNLHTLKKIAKDFGVEL